MTPVPTQYAAKRSCCQINATVPSRFNGHIGNREECERSTAPAVAAYAADAAEQSRTA